MNDFASPTGIDWAPGATHGLAKFGSDANLLVMFYNKPIENPVKSQELGRRFFENKVYVTIQHPGEALTKVDRPATDEDKRRFQHHWHKFVQNRTQVPEGTPIDLLFPNYPASGEMLRAMGIYTVEQCANLSATAIDSIGRGGQEYVNRAKQYLSSAEKGAGFHKFRKEMDEKNQKIKLLEQQVSQLKIQLDAIIGKINDPISNSQTPPYIPGYDTQAARINANHPTKEIAAKAKRRGSKKPVEVADEQPDPLTDPFANSLNNNQDIGETSGQDALS